MSSIDVVGNREVELNRNKSSNSFHKNNNYLNNYNNDYKNNYNTIDILSTARSKNKKAFDLKERQQSIK